MEIDIRNDISDEEIESIRFGKDHGDVLERPADARVVIAAHDEGEVWIKDIDNLIKALKKAKEIWG